MVCDKKVYEFRDAACFVVAVTMALLAGCRSLPRDFDPPEPTFALTPSTEGPIAGFADASAEILGKDESGFLLLDRNDETLRWRLALIDSAERSIDIQTYLWSGDFSGRLHISRLLQAADRGVRVRLLVDDFETRGRDDGIATLDLHPNVEIRIWNPGRSRKLGRLTEYLVRLSELNHRLHNKVLIVDNRVVISGGRNIADEYYGLSDVYNFFDLDLLAVGPVVPPTSKMFDRYWNSHQAWPGEIFYPRASEEDIPVVMAERREYLEASLLSDIIPLDPRDWEHRFDSAVASMIPGEAEVIYDKPGEREPSQDAFFGLQRFFRRAEYEVQALSPYLVPVDAFFVEAKRLHERDVEMTIMTNSLGSTNQTILHAAYARTRRPMIAAGVDVYEMRYDAALQEDLDTPPVVSQWVGLHAKAAVLDRRHVFIGSFNFAPRSKNLNTEMGLLVDSPELGARVASVIDWVKSPDNAWRLRLDENDEMTWESNAGTLTIQPYQNFQRRIQSGFFGVFPLEQHL